MNAKDELLETLEKNFKSVILCADITKEYFDFETDRYTEIYIRLPLNYSQTDYGEFLKKLDFEYDEGYGHQTLYGRVWLTHGGAWLERDEYDGSEWWTFKDYPIIPDYLKAHRDHWELV